MNILFFSHKFYPEIGGIEVNSEILANQFTNFGATVKVVTWTAETGEKKFPFDVIRSPSIMELYELFQWSEIVYENNPVFKMSWLNILFRRPRVVALRTWIRRMDGKRSLTDWLKKQWVSNATAIIAISESIKKDSCKNATVIGNPYRSDLFTVNKTGTSRAKHFIFLGRLVSDKGADMCIELIHHLREKNGQEYSLSIVGNGSEMGTLKKMSTKYNLESNINFCGFLKGKDLVEILNQHHFLLVPSRWEEPFGNVALEGMACGCIPIVSDGGGLPDAVGAAGVVFKRNSISSLVQTTNQLLHNQEHQTRLLQVAKTHLSHHSENQVAERYFDVILKASKS